MKNNHPHTGMQAVFASCLWIYEAFGNTLYIISWDLFLYAAMVFAYSRTVMKHEGIKNKIKEKDRKCFFWKLIRAWFWTGQKQNDKPSWDFKDLPTESSIYHICIYTSLRKLYDIFIYTSYFSTLFSVKAVYTKTECLFSEFICCCCFFSSWSHNARSVTSPLATRPA